LVQNIPGIDVWRGISVVLVVWHHLAIRLPLGRSALGAALPKRLCDALSWNGYEAVMVFFVISGFLITHGTLARDGAPAAVRLGAFYWRRFARIAPPLLLLVAVLSAAHGLGVEHYTIDRSRQSLPVAVLSALTFWLNVYEAETGYLPGGWDVLWSLSVEEAFYLGFPVLLLLARREAVLTALLLPFAAALPVLHALQPAGLWREKAYAPAMAAIAAGAVAALLSRRWAAQGRALPHRLLRGGGAALVLSVLVFGDWAWASLDEGALLVLVVGAAMAVLGAEAAARSGAAPPRWLAPLRAVGRWSYEIYLTHMFVVFGVVSAYGALGWGKAEGAWAWPPALLLSVLLGAAFAKLWSEPLNRRLRAWAAGRPGAGPAAAPPGA